MMTIEQAAEITHELNRAYCHAIGDDSQLPWSDAPEWQKESAVNGVRFHLTGNHDAEASHNAWLEKKKLDGWVWGPEKNADTKEHPCMVPFFDLPLEQQVKDLLFSRTVASLRPLIKA